MPRISVVIPTYNRAALLRCTLRALAAQRMPAADFEVVVSDDGSSDDTRTVVREFARRLPLRYHYQEDLGFRAAAARNAGARLARGPVLAFIDAGMLPGPDFLAAHLRAHDTAGEPGRVVIGYMFGCRPFQPTPGLAEAAVSMSPEEIVDLYGVDDPMFRDFRHDALAPFDFEIPPDALPWNHLWSGNFSVTARDYAAAGGFDEDFRSWGGEDLDLGFRLFRRGHPFVINRQAWAVDTPHERAAAASIDSSKSNVLKILLAYVDPALELCWATRMREQPWQLDSAYRALADWTREAARLDVRDEVAAGTRDVAPGARVVVLGCGGSVPDLPPRTVLCDFDADLLARTADTRPDLTRMHAIGIRTTVPDRSVDTVVVTSRLRGLRTDWDAEITAEIHRISRSDPGG